MAELQPSTCPNCGSPLDVKPGDTRVKCSYCGSSIVVSEHENSTPESPQFSFKIDDQVAHEIGTVGKVTAGIAISSIVLPLVITVMVFCGIGIILFFVFSNVNSVMKSDSVLPPSTAVPLPTPFPSATPYPTPTSVPTPTPFPTPVPFANVLFQDDFSSTSSGWDQLHETNYTLEYKNGSYHVLVGEKDGGQSVWIGDNYTNVSVEVDANQDAGPEDALVGVSCRYAQGVGGYSFEFARDGTYGIYLYDQGSPTALDERILEPNTVNPNGANHIEGMCAGSTLTLILNGEVLMQVDDPTYTSGGAGLIVRTGDSGTPGIDVLFNQFVVKGP
jgi:DNA-directed RNA polymerase subunit RPC12/RpoP